MANPTDGFTEGQEAIIERMIRRIGDGVIEQMPALVERCIKEHALTCPTARKVTRGFWILVGLSMGIGLGGGFTVGSILAAIVRAGG